MAYKKKECPECKVEHFNRKFCSRGCAAKFNNQSIPKRKKTKQCKKCSVKIYSKNTYCQDCYKEWNSNAVGDLTLAQAAEAYSKHHKSSAFALVRSRARTLAKKLGYDKCIKCGYDKHVEIAHVKAISSFDLSTLVSIVNAPENLMALCPNCHWEYDHLE